MSSSRGGDGPAQAIRVIQWATGNVGSQSLRAVIEDPQYQLVGGFTYDPAKSGTDLGTLCGLGEVGVLATNDVDAVVAMDADCVIYNGLGDTGDPAEVLGVLCRLLASGKNVVSTAVSTHIHPEALSDADRAALAEACAAGQVSFHSTGVNPGFSFDLFPIFMSTLGNRIDRIRVLELVDMATYTSASVVSDMIGMGLAPDVMALMDYLDDVRISPYLACFKLLGEAFGLEFDDFTVAHDKAVTPVAIDLPWGKVDAGTVAAKRIRMDALLAGTPVLSYEMVWRVSDDIAPEWPSGRAHYDLVIEGDPTLRCRLDIESDSGRGTSVATSMQAVNAIPSVVAAPPGIRTRLDLPFIAGGFFPAATHESRTP